MRPCAVSFIGKSGSGKTTLLMRLIPLMKKKGLRVGSLKRSHHDIEVDREGKDSWIHREAGADPVMVAGGNMWAMMKSCEGEVRLTDLLDRMAGDADLVLVEGFKNETIPSLVVMRRECGWDPGLFMRENCIGIIADFDPESTLPRFSFEEVEKLADFLHARVVQNVPLNMIK